MPEARLDVPLRDAIELYDQRIRGPSLGANRSGLGRFEDEQFSQSSDINAHAPLLLQVTRNLSSSLDPSPFSPYLNDISSLHEIFSFPLLNSEDQKKTLGALIQLLTTIPRLFSTASITNMRSTGYTKISSSFKQRLLKTFSARTEELSHVFPSLIFNTSLTSLIHNIQTLPIHTFPFTPGPLIRPAGRNLIIDYYMTTLRLYNELELTRLKGADVNKRAQSFELNTQQIIDDSNCAPPHDLRSLRGRPLRHRQQVLTDIDAIACVDHDTLLLVSCKSIPYYDDYEKGDYNTVRNVRTKAEDAVKHWIRIVGLLKANPVGENYDFSQHRQILGIVCFPFPPYLEIGYTTQEVLPGLRMVSSIGELHYWLSKSTTKVGIA